VEGGGAGDLVGVSDIVFGLSTGGVIGSSAGDDGWLDGCKLG